MGKHIPTILKSGDFSMLLDKTPGIEGVNDVKTARSTACRLYNEALNDHDVPPAVTTALGQIYNSTYYLGVYRDYKRAASHIRIAEQLLGISFRDMTP